VKEIPRVLYLSLFGRIELMGLDGPIALPGKKPAALLAYLAASQPTPRSREHIMTLLWGSFFDLQARQNLRQALFGLRQVLGQHVIVAEGDLISLRPGSISCDSQRFEALIRRGEPEALDTAVGLYKDRFLADHKLGEQEWSEWLLREQGRLEEMAISAALALGESELARGRADRAIALAKKAIEWDALREDAHRLVMRAALIAGRKAEALHQYDALVEHLKRELNVEPDDLTARLAAEIRARPEPSASAKISVSQTKNVQSSQRAVLALLEGGEPSDPASLDKTQTELADLLKARVGGRLGQALLLEFPDVRSAIEAANAVRPRRLSMSADTSTSPDVAKRNAANLLQLAGPGQLLVSEDVCDALTDGLDAHLEDLGEHHIGEQTLRAYRAGPPARRGIRSTGARLQPAIAVIPFAVSNGAQDVLGQLLAHELIERLSRSKEFAVISRMSTRAFGGRMLGLADIKGWLAADYALWGNCDLVGGRVSVRAEVAHTESETVVWAGRLEAPANAVEDGFADLVTELVFVTSASILSHELERAQILPLESLENYSLLISAINLVHRTAPDGFARAREVLDHLIERLPRHPLPLAWMAQWHVMKVSQGWANDIVAEGQLALDRARRAADSDPSCSIAIAMEGWVHTHLLKRFDVAAERFRQAVEVNANDSMAWLLKGAMHSFLGQGEAAVEAAERALRLSPLDPRRSYYDCLAASAYCTANLFDRAIELGKRSLRLNRLHTSTLRSLTCSLALSGRMEEARQMAGELMKLEPNLTVTSYLSRHPAAAFWTGKAWADALRSAGVPP
jgi:adenylate cyclase